MSKESFKAFTKRICNQWLPSCTNSLHLWNVSFGHDKTSLTQHSVKTKAVRE